MVLFCFHLGGKVTAQGIRIVPGKLYVKNDSLHVNLTMHLDGISVGSGTAFFFTPVMSGKKKQRLSLPGTTAGRLSSRPTKRKCSPTGRSWQGEITRTLQSITKSLCLMPPGCNKPCSCYGRNTRNVAERSCWHSIR